MSDKVFIDTNVLVYSFDSKNPVKQKVAKELIEDFFDKEEYFISMQVLNEFCSAALRKLAPPLEVEVLREFISSFPKRKILSVNREITLYSLVLMEKYKLQYWDSLIIAAAIDNRCTVLYTEDMQNGLILEDILSIVNPFE